MAGRAVTPTRVDIARVSGSGGSGKAMQVSARAAWSGGAPKASGPGGSRVDARVTECWRRSCCWLPTGCHCCPLLGWPAVDEGCCLLLHDEAADAAEPRARVQAPAEGGYLPSSQPAAPPVRAMGVAPAWSAGLAAMGWQRQRRDLLLPAAAAAAGRIRQRGRWAGAVRQAAAAIRTPRSSC